MGERLDREIEEILQKYERTHSDRRPVRLRTGLLWRLRRRISGFEPPRLRGSHLMLGGIIAVLFAFFFAAFLPDALQRWVMIGGFIVAAIGLLLAILANRRPATTEKRWRGQVIRLEDDSLGARVRGWFGKRGGY
jgi:hypothetical protein